ncbi:MAG: ATP-dependent Clp protease adaptor ClpS [Burkholderiaceae bacterium]|nr:ATP-dependent Clp protease adaptor ClpS [Burkholderiaceae bacterium]
MVLMSQNPKTPPGGNPVIPYREDTALLERQAEKVKVPAMYKVMLLNDDYTPMETATRIMLQVHLAGKGVCGIFTRDVASTKVHQVIERSREAGHPLQCTMEEA